ncbi:Uncharacterized protein GBIM_13794 [Gryllus bimaculatus]|nr:Uncharacterized protein GBIM_13794 [Gryllus bimaculatus]
MFASSSKKDVAMSCTPSVSFRSLARLPLRDAVESRPHSLASWRYAFLPAPAAAPTSPVMGDDTAPPRGQRDQYRVVCFVEGWSAYRREPARFSARNVDPHACTHLVYAFAAIDPHGLHLIPQDEEYDIVKAEDPACSCVGSPPLEPRRTENFNPDAVPGDAQWLRALQREAGPGGGRGGGDFDSRAHHRLRPLARARGRDLAAAAEVAGPAPPKSGRGGGGGGHGNRRR